jgi:ribonuclease G
MNEEILVNVTPYETRVALVVQGAVQELHLERSAERGLVGNIYLGKVARVLPGMQSAFIDIGLDKAAFLHVADIWFEKPAKTDEPPRSIEKILFEGQSLLVQVIKDPIGTKGARLSTQISIAGRMLVYLPQDNHIGISQKIDSESERQALRERVQKLLPVNSQGGFIIRTVAEEASDDELASDIRYLHITWQRILDNSTRLPSPQIFYEDLRLAQRVLRDIAHESTTILPG